MHGEMRQIQKKRLVPVPVDEVDRAVGEKIRQICIRVVLGFWIGGEVEVPSGGADCFVEATLAGVVCGLFAQVPLAEHAGFVTGRLECIRKRLLL